MATICSRWCVTWWHICNEWIHLYTLQKQLKTKKTKDAWPGMCKWSSVKWHPTGFTEYISIGEKVISPWIPFITILVMRWYGGHYKVNGPPINIPATLDQSIEILPRMPSELQLNSVNLKYKLAYKSHYMYNMIHRDCVISAITWLKEHNSHYADIKLNEHWYNDIASRELSVQLDENDKHVTVTVDAVLHSHYKMKILAKTN